jgi:hypothetical protein
MMKSKTLLRWGVLGISAVVALTGCASTNAGTGAGGVGPGTLDLELGYGSEPPVDLPLSWPDVNADTTQAIQAIESRRKADALGQGNRPDPGRRPDLDHDVTQGIQSRGVDRAIGR